MFMNTTLSSYYLPLYGAGTAGLGTEIGGDARSIFVRPITAAGKTVLPEKAATSDVSSSKVDYKAFDAWLADYSSYRRAATSQTDAANDNIATGGTTPGDTASDADGTPTNPQSAGAGETSGGEAGEGGAASGQNGSATGDTQGGTSGSGGNGSAGSGGGRSGSGGLFGWLFG